MFIGSPWQLWAIAVLSFAFAAMFAGPGKLRLMISLGVVAALTLLLPVCMLVFIGEPTYGSVAAVLTTVISTSMEHGQLGGLEWFVPLLAAGAGAAVGRRHAL